MLLSTLVVAFLSLAIPSTNPAASGPTHAVSAAVPTLPFPPSQEPHQRI
jgi:hypothetical protein